MERADAGRHLRAHRRVTRLEAEAVRGRDGVDSDVAAALSQRIEHERAIVLELARGLLLAQHVRADQPERPVVGHDPDRHERPDPLAELMRVEPADRDDAPPLAELVPAAHVPLRRVVEHALRCGEQPDQPGEPVDLLARVVGEVPELDAVERLAVEGAIRHPGPPEPDRALGERVRREPEAARVAHRPRDRARVQAAAAHVVVDAERQVVVAPDRRDLVAGEQEHVAVPALLAEPPRSHRVVVCEQHDVRAGARGRSRDLGHGARAVGVRRVEVDHTGQVVHSPQLHSS